MPLRTDYTNDILDTSKNTERKYNIKNSNGTIVEENVTFEDVTEYEQEGSRFGASDINATNIEVNKLNQILTDLLSNVILPIDTSRKIYSNNNLTYTATENCWVEAQVLAQTPHTLAYARVDNITFLATAASTSNVAVYNKGCFYVRKGQTVNFNGLSGYYNVYGCISV